MKNLFRTIATLTLVTSSAFLAHASVAQPSAETSPAPAMYCWKDKLQVTGTAFICNWADNAEEACKGNPVSNIGKDTVSGEPINARRCNNGQWLVQVTRK